MTIVTPEIHIVTDTCFLSVNLPATLYVLCIIWLVTVSTHWVCQRLLAVASNSKSINKFCLWMRVFGLWFRHLRERGRIMNMWVTPIYASPVVWFPSTAYQTWIELYPSKVLTKTIDYCADFNEWVVLRCPSKNTVEPGFVVEYREILIQQV